MISNTIQQMHLFMLKLRLITDPNKQFLSEIELYIDVKSRNWTYDSTTLLKTCLLYSVITYMNWWCWNLTLIASSLRSCNNASRMFFKIINSFLSALIIFSTIICEKIKEFKNYFKFFCLNKIAILSTVRPPFLPINPIYGKMYLLSDTI